MFFFVNLFPERHNEYIVFKSSHCGGMLSVLTVSEHVKSEVNTTLFFVCVLNTVSHLSMSLVLRKCIITGEA